MKIDILDLIDFAKVDTLLEGFNNSTGFVTAIIDLDGNILSKSGWRQICTEFHRINPETSKRCSISDTELANKMGEGEKYHFYKCLNGLVDVAVPIIINGEHIANLFSGQFFFEEPDGTFFKKQAEKYKFDEVKYMAALKNVPIVSQEKVKTAMDFLQNMTQMISEMTFQKLEQIELNRIIRESEENLSITLHSIGDGVITTDKSGKIDRMNPVALKLCGWQADEIKGKSLTEVFNIIDVYTREPVLNPVERVIENGEIVGLANHTVLVAKDGKEYQIADSAAPIKDKDGNIMGVVLVFSDVSEKYAAEEERRKSDERFRIAQEMSPDGFTILHPVRDAQNRVIDFTWIYENDAIARLNGTDPQKVVGQRLLELFPEHRNVQFFKTYQQVAESGESITFEEGYASESMHKQTWFRIVVVPMGENIAVLAQDITNRKQAEEKLTASDRIFNHSLDMLCIAGFDGYFKVLNPAWTKILGWSNEELLSKPWIDFVHHNDREASNDIKSVIVDGDEVYQFENRYICKDGTIKCLSWNSFPYPEENIMFGVARDVTIQKQAEAELKISKEEALESEAKLSALFSTMSEMVVLHELVFDDNGKPVNYRITDCNDAFTKITGITRNSAVGRLATEVYGTGEPPYLDEYLKVAFNGEPYHYETYFEPMDKYFSISVICHEKNHFATVTTDITERKHSELALLEKMDELERFHKLTVGREITMVELKKEVNNLLKKIGEDPKYKIVE